MDIIWDMCLQTIEVFTLVVGILGVSLSLFLMVAPDKSRALSDFCNRYFEFDKKLTRLIDRDIQTETLIYRHNIIAGVCLIVGSAFILVFLFYRLDVRSFITVFLGPQIKFLPASFRISVSLVLQSQNKPVLQFYVRHHPGNLLLLSSQEIRRIPSRLFFRRLLHRHIKVPLSRPAVFSLSCVNRITQAVNKILYSTAFPRP